MSADVLLPAVVLVPALVATIALPLPRRLQMPVGIVGAFLSAGLGLWLVASVARVGALEHVLAGWAPPLGIALRADGLSAAFILLTSLVALGASVYAASEEDATGRVTGFWPLTFLVWCGLNACFVTGDLFNAYVSLEVLSLAAVGLVALGGTADAAKAALRYLVVAVVGSFLVLLAVGYVYAAAGTLDMRLAGEILADDPSLTRLPLAFAAAGLALKTALWPLHAWLPPAHAGAPPAVSALLSALVVKGSYYLLLRLWLDVFAPDAIIAAVLGVLGTGAVLAGGLVALRQSHLKRVVAYSTIAQVGYLFLVFPLLIAAPTTEDRALVLAAAVVMALAHGFAKAALFLAAGTLVLGTGTDEIDGLVGTSREQRTVTAAMMIAAISLVGLPISLGFIAKWEYLAVAITSGTWWVVIVLLLGSLLAAGYVLRPIAATLRDSDTEEEVGRVDPSERPAAQRFIPLALALCSLIGGMFATELIGLSLVGIA
ncbi:MAG: proton-conducting transporter membrane subunit [Mobilicoccus sp.]|nr:proton-conducting transporter membrane subunit [Mobilicoccus sp.]